MNRRVLQLSLRQSFPDSGVPERRAVARLAGDLADSGRYRKTTGAALTPDTVVENLRDAPGEPLTERWNWWLGALDIAHDGCVQFRVP